MKILFSTCNQKKIISLPITVIRFGYIKSKLNYTKEFV